jgi:phospholipase C
MRVSWIVAVAAGCGVLPFVCLSACSSSQASGAQGPDCTEDGGFADDGAALTPCAWDQPVTRPDDTTANMGRASCKYGRGDMPAATLGPGIPIGDDIPIENIVWVTMENHSFDSYLGHLAEYAHYPAGTTVEEAPAGASNPDAMGNPQPWTHAQHLCTLDTNHEWSGTHQEIDTGKMDGFVVANDGWDRSALPASSMNDPTLWSGARAMWWYDQRDIPFYYQLAATFAVADHYFCSVPGPTWPNRMYEYAATSFGETTNVFPDISAYPYPESDATILDELEKRHTSWLLYSDGPPGAGTVYGTAGATRWGRRITAPFAQFQADAAAGNLPAVSFVDPDLGSELNQGADTDEHPPGDIQSGQQFVGKVVQAVTSSPQWPHIALFITHDEHGGFYDHVPPPKACAPDGKAPILDPGDTTQGGFDQYGVRVLLIVVSPYAKKAYVGHHVYDHTSITRFIEAKFRLPALTARDANAEPPTDLFDFQNPPFTTPPPLTPPTVDPTELDYCETTFGK